MWRIRDRRWVRWQEVACGSDAQANIGGQRESSLQNGRSGLRIQVGRAGPPLQRAFVALLRARCLKRYLSCVEVVSDGNNREEKYENAHQRRQLNGNASWLVATPTPQPVPHSQGAEREPQYIQKSFHSCNNQGERSTRSYGSNLKLGLSQTLYKTCPQRFRGSAETDAALRGQHPCPRQCAHGTPSAPPTAKWFLTPGKTPTPHSHPE